MITDINQLDLNKRYTYADYLNWKFDEMVELIRGRVYRMSPAPNLNHQRVSSRLLRNIFKFLNQRQCEVFHAPFDVRLPLPSHMVSDDKIDTVVQPDICVICDPDKLEPAGCVGAPDWIIEILSPGTSSKDLNEKFDVYEHAGVTEYWVVHPFEHTLLIYRLDESGRYVGMPKPFTKGEIVSTSVFPEFQLALIDVFGEN